jgi:hypothetical protein
MAYSRGSRDDWDGYASIANDRSFQWDAMTKYMAKNELFGLPDTNRSIVRGTWMIDYGS